tara:strand:+ start:192 stop:446 length:255 start_codon:yes stop_codon:yes gene_type:complete
MGRRISAGRLQRLLGEASPVADNTFDLGASDRRWANIYTGDLHLENERGSYTMVEEAEYLTIRNNKTGKTYKLMMEEIVDGGNE